MRDDILRNLQQEIYDRCQKETNKFGMGCYYHIVAVVKMQKFWLTNMVQIRKLL